MKLEIGAAYQYLPVIVGSNFVVRPKGSETNLFLKNKDIFLVLAELQNYRYKIFVFGKECFAFIDDMNGAAQMKKLIDE